jgi:hypothetical protein
MKNRLLNMTIIFILPLILAFVWTSPALAQGPVGDQVIFGDNLVLEAEENIKGDVVVFGGNVTMPPSSQINGDLVVFGGNADIDGTVTGDIGMIGGNVKLSETAVVKGDIGLLGGNADVAEGAIFEGTVQSFNRFGFGDGEGFTIPPIPSVVPAPPIPPDSMNSSFSGSTDRAFGFFREVFEDVAALLSLAVIGWLVAAFMPEQMKVAGDTLTQSAPLSFGLGVLTILIAAVLGGVLLITICLAFIPLLGYIVLGIATLFGWIVAGQVIGERLLVASGRPFPSPVGSTVLGVTVLTTVVVMPIIGQVPCIGFIFGLVGGLVGIIVALTGLGAVILTRFGTQPYPPSAYAFGGVGSPAPNPAPTTRGNRPHSELLSSLERSEAELRAKIKAALAEADAAEEIPPVDQPINVEPPDEPSPENSAAEEPDTEDNVTGQKPARKRRQPKKSAEDPDDGEPDL